MFARLVAKSAGVTSGRGGALSENLLKVLDGLNLQLLELHKLLKKFEYVT